MTPTNYTTKQVAGRLGLAPATIRSYSSKFNEHLSTTAQPGRRQRAFTPEDLETLAVARELLATGLTYTEVNERLLEGVATLVNELDLEPPEVQPDAEQVTGTAMITAEQVRALMQPLGEAVSAWQELAEKQRLELDRKDHELERKDAELLDLRNEVSRLREEEQRQPWWRRWFRE